MTATEPSAPRRAGSLQPVELAQASVMAALCAATAIVAVVVPFAAGVSLLGTVPMGLLAYRYRLRVLIAATVAGAVIAFLIAGMGGFMTVVNCAYIGGLTGIVKRRGRGIATVFCAALVAGALFGLATVAALAVLARLRHLIFDSVTANINGLAAMLARIPDMEPAAERLKRDFATAAGLLAVPVLRLVGDVHRHRHVHRLVGAVAGDGAGCSGFPTCTSWSRRPTPDRSPRYRPGCTTSDSATPRPTTTPSARCR